MTTVSDAEKPRYVEVTVSLAPGLADCLGEWAKRKGRTLADAVRDAVEREEYEMVLGYGGTISEVLNAFFPGIKDEAEEYEKREYPRLDKVQEVEELHFSGACMVEGCEVKHPTKIIRIGFGPQSSSLIEIPVCEIHAGIYAGSDEWSHETNEIVDVKGGR